MAAAAAWQLSQKSRVLIISLDPAHNLGDIFGVDLKDKKSCYTNTLYLKEIDLQKLSKEYLQREINVLSGTYKYLQTLNLTITFPCSNIHPA